MNCCRSVGVLLLTGMLAGVSCTALADESADPGKRLVAAIISNDMNELAAILDETPSLAMGKGPHGRTLLHGVASRGNVDAARVFLEHGADVNATDDEGGTPLMMAVLMKQAAMVHYLLDVGADPTIRLTTEGNPMAADLVSIDQRDIYDTVKKATVRKSDPMMAWIQSVGRGDVSEMKLILAAHPEYGPSAYPGKGWPLFMAVASGKREAVLFLLDVHAPVDSQEENGATPLFLTVTSENADIANLLIDHGADPNTVLTAAAGECKLAMLQLLLDRGADVNYLDHGTTALDHAQLTGHDDCINLLKKKGAKRAKDL